MKNRVPIAILVLGIPSLATAGELRLYDPVDPSLVRKDAEAKVLDMSDVCAGNDMRRIGPSPAQQKRCDDAVQKVSALGKVGAYAALAHLDDDRRFGRRNLYEVIGNSDAFELVEPLVRALEREAVLEKGERHYEVNSIVYALTALTYAAPKGTPSIEWRKWADAHRGIDRAALLRESEHEEGVKPKKAGDKAKLVAGEPTS